jgi:hypothetical protein
MNVVPTPRRWPLLAAAARTVIVPLIFSVAGAPDALAYIGPSFLHVPGIAGGAPGTKYKNWIRFEANYWGLPPPHPLVFEGTGRKRTFFSGPRAPRQGAGTLSVALDKQSPALASLMEQCANKAKLPELTYSESSDMARAPAELGVRPADIPEYFEYKLKDVELSCPIVADAPEQAFVLSFSDVQWLNYQGQGEGKQLTPAAAKLTRAQSSGETKTFIVTWFSSAADITDDQCPVMNSRPTEDDYYALMSKEDAAKEKAERASKGGVAGSPTDGQIAFRGPGKLNVCGLPGIVRDPGHISPQSTVAHGFNLDGDDGAGDPPPLTRKHKNYVSEDGRSGIDNQLFSVDGCIKGFKRSGLLTMARNETRRNGLVSMLVEINGIDNDQNDKSVDVTVLYSKDAMAKNAAGNHILPNYTFRVSDDPELTELFARFHGRIVNGVLTTDPIKEMTLSDGREPRFTLYAPRMRLEIKPDGTLKGVIGGYQDWRVLMNFWASYTSGFESFMGYQCPGAYNAFKRAADGLKDPVTGEFNGISSAYDMEGVPAFIPPEQHKALVASRSDDRKRQ